MNLDINQQKRIKYLIVVFIILMIIFFVIIIEKRVIQQLPNLSQYAPSPKRLNIDFNVLKNPLLQEFQTFEKISLPGEIEIGRENPFIPY